MSKLGRVIVRSFVILAVVMAVIGGLMLVGSPSVERMRRLDEQRKSDLQLLQDFVRLHWDRHKTLPSNLLITSNEPGYYLIHSDPETKQPYEYRVIDTKRYELCAIFSSDTIADRGNPNNNFWSHTTGRQCFNFDAEAARR